MKELFYPDQFHQTLKHLQKKKKKMANYNKKNYQLLQFTVTFFNMAKKPAKLEIYLCRNGNKTTQ